MIVYFWFLSGEHRFFSIGFKGLPKSLRRFQKKNISKPPYPKNALTLWEESPRYKTVSHIGSFWFLSGDNVFFTLGLNCTPHYFHRCYWKSASNPPSQHKVIPLCEESRHKAVSQIASFWSLSGNTCFSTIALKGVPNILWQMTPNKCFQPAEAKDGFTSARWIHLSQTQFTESFFLLLLWGYLISQHRPPWAPKYALANSR